jgi:hypothetical protein
MRLIRGVCLAGLLWPVVAQAQVQNGDFEAGAAGWTWRYGQTQSHQGCVVDQQGDFLTKIYGHGQLAYFWAGQTYASGTTYFCRRIQQTLTVPQGMQLVYDAMLGEASGQFPNMYWDWAPVSLDVSVSSGNVTLAGQSSVGATQFNDCDLHDSCPRFVTHKLDVTKAWGQSVVLTMHTRSSQENWGGGMGAHHYASSAFVDNVRFEPAPLPSIPIIKDPAINGRDHSISWGEVDYTSQYRLEQSIDNGPWVQVYSGLNLGWSLISAPSGNYRYRAQACGNGCSGMSGEVAVLVPQAAPGSLTGIVVGRTFEMSWGSSEGAQRYVLEQKGEDGVWVTAYDGPATQSTLYNIAPGIYSYRAKACGASLCSDYSSQVNVTAVDVTPVTVDYIL